MSKLKAQGSGLRTPSVSAKRTPEVAPFAVDVELKLREVVRLEYEPASSAFSSYLSHDITLMSALSPLIFIG